LEKLDELIFIHLMQYAEELKVSQHIIFGSLNEK